jgi:hypothetical protein
MNINDHMLADSSESQQEAMRKSSCVFASCNVVCALSSFCTRYCRFDHMDDEKRILVFSDAGGPGRSYHADLACQPASAHSLSARTCWRADAAIQGWGARTAPTRSSRRCSRSRPTSKAKSAFSPRSPAASTPWVRSPAVNGGPAARGLFRADDNLESPHAEAALRQFYQLLYAGKIEGCSLDEFQDPTGLDLVDRDGSLREQLPPITQFSQPRAGFAHRDAEPSLRLLRAIARSAHRGCDCRRRLRCRRRDDDRRKFRITERRTVCTYAATGAETRCYRY